MNKRLKQILSVAVVAASAALTARADEPLCVALIGSDGTRTEMALPEIERVDIGTDGVTVHALGAQHKVAYGDIDRFLIGVEMSAVDDLVPDGGIAVWPTKVSASVSVAGVAAGEEVSVAAVSGAVVAVATADADGHASIDLSSAATGVYVVYTKSFSTKIVKQ